MMTKIKERFPQLKGSFIWIFSIGCIVFGILIAFISLLMVGFDLNRLNTDGEWEQRTLVQPLGEISEIHIDSRNVRIEVRPSGGDEIVITYFENNHTTFTETTTNNSVSLIQDRNTNRIFHQFGVRFNVGQGGIVVEIPEKALLAGDFRTRNGRIEISEMSFDKLQARSSNGVVRLSEVAVDGEVIVDTTNAMIQLSDSDFNDHVSLSTTNGNINIEDVNLAGNLTMRTSSGGGNLTNVTSTGDLTLRTTNGRIETRNVTARGDMDFSTTNGAVNLERTIFNNANITTTNGRVTINDLQDHEDYRIVTRTSNARTIIGELRLEGRNNSIGDGERLLDIRTSNGNIEVRFD